MPVAAVEKMVAALADGAPLGRLLAQAWPDAAVRMTDALVNGVALGWSPRKTARAMAEGLQQGALGRCLTIARTEQMRVYRQASLQTYRASGVVRGCKRLAAKGLARWDLWRSGQVSLDEMVGRHGHPVRGGSLGVRPVAQTLGGAEALQRVLCGGRPSFGGGQESGG